MEITYQNFLKPWLIEPNKKTWIDKKTRLRCEIHRHPILGHLCGYVNIGPEHLLFKVELSDLNLRVHGGVSFTDFLENSFEDSWKIGFDCAHYNDITPYHITHLKGVCATYKTMKYVKKQCKKLAKQIYNYKE